MIARAAKRREIMNTIPIYCSLDSVTDISPTLEGVRMGRLEACDMIQAQTRNSIYEIFLLDPKSGHAIVRGGEHFAEPLEAIVSGSTFGGSMLKMGWLGVGFQMEILANGQRTVTSPIRSLRVERIDFDAVQLDSTLSEPLEMGNTHNL
jgi:hypothetical protein